MTPVERVDEYIDEHFHHRWDVLDEQGDLIEKYILLDGTKALPRIIERMNRYDPSRQNGNKITAYWKFEACWFLLNRMDVTAFRLRSSEEGRRAIDALEKSVERMRAAGFAVDDIDDGEKHSDNGIYIMVGNEVKEMKGVNLKDKSIQEAFRILYKVKLSDSEILDFSNYLIERYPDYPSWSKMKMVKDETQINSAGNPLQFHIVETPKRYYEAYLEFKK